MAERFTEKSNSEDKKSERSPQSQLHENLLFDKEHENQLKKENNEITFPTESPTVSCFQTYKCMTEMK